MKYLSKKITYLRKQSPYCPPKNHHCVTHIDHKYAEWYLEINRFGNRWPRGLMQSIFRHEILSSCYLSAYYSI